MAIQRGRSRKAASQRRVREQHSRQTGYTEFESLEIITADSFHENAIAELTPPSAQRVLPPTPVAPIPVAPAKHIQRASVDVSVDISLVQKARHAPTEIMPVISQQVEAAPPVEKIIPLAEAAVPVEMPQLLPKPIELEYSWDEETASIASDHAQQGEATEPQTAITVVCKSKKKQRSILRTPLMFILGISLGVGIARWQELFVFYQQYWLQLFN